MSTTKNANTLVATGSMPFKLPPQSTCILGVTWATGSYYTNRLTLYGPDGEVIWRIQRPDQPPQRQFDNKSNAQQTYTLYGEHMVPGQSEWLSDMALVLSRNPSNTILSPLSMIVGFEDHGDQSYNDIHVALNFNYN